MQIKYRGIEMEKTQQLFKKAEKIQKEAWAIIEDSGVIKHWSSIGATINLVGSLKTGLLINNRDIDFHIYTNPFKLSDSFSVISKLAENKRVKTIKYLNLLEADDRCVSWHVYYEDQNKDMWQIDMIHILNDSPYAGYFENVTERISQILTKETKETILRIKNSIPPDKKVPSIQIYQAVIRDKIRKIEDFWQWKEQNQNDGIITWIP